MHQKENRIHRTSKIVKSRQSYGNGHVSYHCPFNCLDMLERALIHDVACAFGCTIKDAQKQLARTGD